MTDSAPLTAYEIKLLNQYNGEHARGLMHTEKWKKEMAELQQRYSFMTHNEIISTMWQEEM